MDIITVPRLVVPDAHHLSLSRRLIVEFSTLGLPVSGRTIATLGFVSVGLAMTALVLRLWSRRLQGVSLAFNDYMAVAAMVFTAGNVAMFLSAWFVGALSTHSIAELKETNPEALRVYRIIFVPGQVLWVSANTCVKLSILSLYTATFPNKTFVRVCRVTMAVSMAYFVATLLETFLICRPVQYTWDKTVPNGKCANENLASLLLGMVNFLIDAFIVALPVPKLYGLQLPLARRLAIGAMFMLGVIICVLSFLRNVGLLPGTLKGWTRSGTAVAVFTFLEPTLGVVNACLPITRPALRLLFKKLHFILCSSCCWGQKRKGQGQESKMGQKKKTHEGGGSHNISSFASNSNTEASGYYQTEQQHQYRQNHFGDGLPWLGYSHSEVVVSNRRGAPPPPPGSRIVVLREWDVSLSPTSPDEPSLLMSSRGWGC